MARIHVFGDEAGNFDFSSGRGASRYFILTTVSFFDDRVACAKLQELRYQLAWEGAAHPGPFHATTDPQSVRNLVFEAIAPHQFRIDSTIFEKAKVHPRWRTTPERFYRYAWFYHLRFVMPELATSGEEVLLIAASIGTHARQVAFHAGVESALSRSKRQIQAMSTHWPAAADPGLQIADYCCWAVQRKWERDDIRSYRYIKDRLATEFDIFERSTRVHH